MIRDWLGLAVMLGVCVFLFLLALIEPCVILLLWIVFFIGFYRFIRLVVGG